ncbi:peptide chain release factor N(5)-glutamine methyltransferase [Candidatus Kaiserbacteria bacterium]|nr:peptide chain release factor N(5)-glutamine methyltransferase [Candidatus Kaiserbacteria bacterium]
MENEGKWLLEEKYNGVPTPEYEQDLARLKAGEPLAYIIGHIPFLGTTIYLDSRPLIPRPETEYWVEQIIKDMPESPRVLDLCAGSGCIGIAVQSARPNAQVDFAEIDERHHETIRKNGGEQIYGGDLFENLTRKYDYILTNPPYIDPEIDRAEESVKAYEPHNALYGGEDGMELITRIIEEAPHYLKEGGTLVIEHEPEQAEEIARLATESGFACETKKDQYGTCRWSILKRD